MGRFGLVFPGQGAQHPGMAQNLYRGHQSVRELFAEAGNVLGKEMVSLCFTGPQQLLDLTMNTQIAVLTVAASSRVRQDGLRSAPGSGIPGWQCSRGFRLRPFPPPFTGKNEGSAGPADHLPLPLGDDRL